MLHTRSAPEATAGSIRVISAAELMELGRELFEEHAAEVSRTLHLAPVNFDRKRYERLEEIGALLVLAAWSHSGELVGYSVNTISPHLHYRDLIVAQNDVLFVRRNARASKIGLHLIQRTEELARERGARMCLWHAKEDTALERLLPRLGYDTHEITFAKEL
ncbi:MAG: GNAT family N-acetyltransferase [bacterium]|nr:GNAT family N-acetyltransferase [bacterium]